MRFPTPPGKASAAMKRRATTSKTKKRRGKPAAKKTAGKSRRGRPSKPTPRRGRAAAAPRKAKKTKPPASRSKTPPPADLERLVRRLQGTRRRLERQLTAAVQEIGILRQWETRARMLEAELEKRDGRLRDLEGRLAGTEPERQPRLF